MSENLNIEFNHIPAGLARNVKAELEKMLYKKIEFHNRGDYAKLSNRIIYLEGRLSSHIITREDDWQLLRLSEIISLRKISIIKRYCDE